MDVAGVDVGPVQVGAQDGQVKRLADELLEHYPPAAVPQDRLDHAVPEKKNNGIVIVICSDINTTPRFCTINISLCFMVRGYKYGFLLSFS